jgi:hypothetical protein
MNKILRQSIVLLTVLTLVLIPFGTTAPAQDQSKEKGPKAISIAADLTFARPVGFIATVAGSVLFILALPFSAMGGNTGETARKLVVEPAKYTFSRPLGRFPQGTLGSME